MKWQAADKQKWYEQQRIQRSYLGEVVGRIQSLRPRLVVEQYGALTQGPDAYPLFIITSKNSDSGKKTVLVTGGVHGYETSGVFGAIRFFEALDDTYLEAFHFVCTPCISPWAFETINRWNAKAIDPNRSFTPDSEAEECRLFLAAMRARKVHPLVHFDLHETTDTDNSVFRPALENRDGIKQEFSEIPDGFYVVGDAERPQREFQKAVIDSVRRVTHIAPPDKDGKIIGVPIEQEGVINYPLKKLNLCAGFSDAEYTTTTEVYPDSPKVNDQICVDAQVAAIRGGLDFLLKKMAT